MGSLVGSTSSVLNFSGEPRSLGDFCSLDEPDPSGDSDPSGGPDPSGDSDPSDECESRGDPGAYGDSVSACDFGPPVDCGSDSSGDLVRLDPVITEPPLS